MGGYSLRTNWKNYESNHMSSVLMKLSSLLFYVQILTHSDSADVSDMGVSVEYSLQHAEMLLACTLPQTVPFPTPSVV